MRFARMILGAVVLAAALGIANAASALPPQITVTAPTRMEIMRNGQPTGKMSLTVGTKLTVDGVSGQYVLVRIGLMKGRVPAKDTDLAAQDPGAAQEAAQSAQAAVPSPTAKPSPLAAATAKPVSVLPVSTTPARPAAPAPAAPARLPLVRPPPPRLGTVPLLLFWAAVAITVVSYWRMYEKAGRPGWASVVPIYNLVVLLQICGKPVWWVILYFIPFLNLVVAVLCCFAVAEKFGKDKAFGLGLALLPFIFAPLLAFGDAVFIGTPGGDTADPITGDGAQV
jgi:Family of unknown function (DUF5684)